MFLGLQSHGSGWSKEVEHEVRISSIKVDGYRRFIGQTIRLEDEATVVAGANNSGKTSLIDLLRAVLKKESRLRAEDLNSARRFIWLKALVETAIAGEDAFKGLQDGDDVWKLVPGIDVRIHVTYDPSRDDIREFADYLMDLDTEKSSFYFQYKFHAKRDALAEVLTDLYPVLREVIDQNEWSNFDDIEIGSPQFLKVQSEVDVATERLLVAEAFFADEAYSNVVKIEKLNDFKGLFNFRSVKASRELDDMSTDRSSKLNSRLVEVAKEDEKWSEILSKLPKQVVAAIDDTGIRSLTSEETLKSLNEVIDSISKTSGTSQSDLFVDFQMTEEQAIELIAKSMQTRYLGEGVPLGEASQGLGYSNLIYLHLETESFIRSVGVAENKLLVNILVIEEPESHMHPQMQNAFIKPGFTDGRAGNEPLR
ncbi:MAG: AAA family ATPase [Leucobacter sp.]